jgi:hypothetical protein
LVWRFAGAKKLQPETQRKIPTRNLNIGYSSQDNSNQDTTTQVVKTNRFSIQ